MSITYLRGPLGWVILRDGKPIGTIKSRGRVYLVSMDGFRPGVDPKTRGTHTFPSLRAAKRKAENIAKGQP